MDARRLAPYAPLAAILLFALALQTVMLWRLPTISADGITFIRLVARQMVEAPIETWRTEDQHPGYPAMLLAATQVVEWLGYRDDPESWMAGAMLVSFTCGLASIAVVWLFARDLFDAKIASVAAIVFTVLPVPRADAVDAQSDTPHALVYLLAAWMATTGITHGNLWRLAAAGAASGVAYWIRPEGLEVVLVAWVVLAVYAWRSAWPWRKTAVALATLACTALVVAVPYPLLAGKLTSKQLVFAKVEPTPTYLEVAATVPDPAAAPGATAERHYSPKLVLALLGAAVAAFINSICQGFKFVFIPLYLLGDVGLAWRRPPIVQIVFLALLGGLHIVILMGVYVNAGYVAHRHVIPIVGLAMPFVALGLFTLGGWVARLLRTRPAYPIVALLVVSCAVVLPYTLRPLNWEFIPVIEATRWIQARGDAPTGIVCNSPYVPFYGKMPVAMLGPEALSLDEALAEAPPGVPYDYVVLHVNAHGYRPEWLDQLHQSYEPVLELPDPVPNHKERKVLVLRAPARPAAGNARAAPLATTGAPAPVRSPLPRPAESRL